MGGSSTVGVLHASPAHWLITGLNDEVIYIQHRGSTHAVAGTDDCMCDVLRPPPWHGAGACEVASQRVLGDVNRT